MIPARPIPFASPSPAFKRFRGIAFAALITSVCTLPVMTAEEVTRREANSGNVILEDVPEVPATIADKLRRYQNVRGASFQDWTEDGSGLFVTTRFGEVSQLHQVDQPGGARRQLTFFDEPVRAISRQPYGSRLAFGMDAGGSENFQIYLFDVANGDHQLLTDGTSRNGNALWSRDGRRLAYQSTRRNQRSNDIWVLEAADPKTAQLLLEAPDGAWWGPLDWSPDQKRLLVLQYVSVTDSRVHLVEVASGERSLLLGGEKGEGNYSSVGAKFTPDGKGLYLAHDRQGLFNTLYHYDLASGEMTPLTADIPWNVEAFALSDNGERAAFVVNQGGIGKLFLMDPKSHKYAPVDSLPIGQIFGPEFNPSGSQLAFTLNGATSPSDVYSLTLGEQPLEAEALQRWTQSEVGGLKTSRFVTPELIQYPTFDVVGESARKIPAFLYKPKGKGPHPVIVSIHGGPEGQYRPTFSSTYQLWAAHLGAAVIAPNVRGSTGYGKEYVRLDNGMLREDSVRDIGALLDWIDTQPDLDSERVAVYGGSYGGYMVLASLVHYGDRLRAGVDVVGISNFVTFLENTQDYRRDLRRVEYGDERDPEMRKHLLAISPNLRAAEISTPLLVVQGANDPRVPLSESEQIVRDVRAGGHDVWYIKALNEGHGFRKKENRDLFQEAVVLFFERYLLDQPN